MQSSYDCVCNYAYLVYFPWCDLLISVSYLLVVNDYQKLVCILFVNAKDLTIWFVYAVDIAEWIWMKHVVMILSYYYCNLLTCLASFSVINWNIVFNCFSYMLCWLSCNPACIITYIAVLNSWTVCVYIEEHIMSFIVHLLQILNMEEIWNLWRVKECNVQIL